MAHPEHLQKWPLTASTLRILVQPPRSPGLFKSLQLVCGLRPGPSIPRATRRPEGLVKYLNRVRPPPLLGPSSRASLPSPPRPGAACEAKQNQPPPNHPQAWLAGPGLLQLQHCGQPGGTPEQWGRPGAAGARDPALPPGCRPGKRPALLAHPPAPETSHPRGAGPRPPPSPTCAWPPAPASGRRGAQVTGTRPPELHPPPPLAEARLRLPAGQWRAVAARAGTRPDAPVASLLGAAGARSLRLPGNPPRAGPPSSKLRRPVAPPGFMLNKIKMYIDFPPPPSF